MIFASFAITAALMALVIGAGAALTRPLWESRAWLAFPYGLVALGVLAQTTWALAWWSGRSVAVVPWAVVVLGVGILLLGRAWAWWSELFVPVALWAGGALALVGFALLWGGATEPSFGGMASRFNPLPVDNYLQYLFAYDLRENIPTTLFIGDWNGSDRPPLQSGIILLSDSLRGLLGVDTRAPIDDPGALQWGLGASIAAQTIWIPAAWSLLRSLRFANRSAVLAAALLVAVPSALVNTVFTWPKMMSAAFMLAGLAILVELARARTARLLVPLSAAAMAYVSGFLSHGGAAFCVPVFLVLGVIAWRRQGARMIVGLGAAAGAAAGLYAPWWAYGHWADPVTGRLLKWHFAGVIPPDDRGVGETVVDAYGQLSLEQILRTRWDNLTQVLDPALGTRLQSASIAEWRGMDFHSTVGAMGVGALAFLIAALWVAVRAAATRELPHGEGRLRGAVVVGSVLSVVFWAVSLFAGGQAVPHQGSYLWVLVLGGVAVAWIADRSIGAAVLLGLGQWSYAAVVYTMPGQTSQHSDLYPLAAVVCCVGVGLVVLVATITALRQPPGRLPESA